MYYDVWNDAVDEEERDEEYFGMEEEEYDNLTLAAYADDDEWFYDVIDRDDPADFANCDSEEEWMAKNGYIPDRPQR